MKVRVCALMMTLLLALCAGCGQRTDALREQTERFRETLTTADLSFTCELNIDYGDRVYDFTLGYARDADGADTLTVLAPETIAGLSAAIDGESLQLLFNDARLETGALANGLSAVTALPMMLSAWATGSVVSYGKNRLDETDCSVIEFITYADEGELRWQLWLDAAAGTPVYAEAAADGVAAVCCRFRDFVLHADTL